MLNSILVNFYERDIHKLIEEVNLFRNEEDLWRTQGSVKNLSGNLVLHIIGGLNHPIGVECLRRIPDTRARSGKNKTTAFIMLTSIKV